MIHKACQRLPPSASLWVDEFERWRALSSIQEPGADGVIDPEWPQFNLAETIPSRMNAQQIALHRCGAWNVKQRVSQTVDDEPMLVSFHSLGDVSMVTHYKVGARI